VIPTSFEYTRATSVADAVAKLAAGGKLVAGGHSLLPLMKLRLSEPQGLIDIARLADLKGIREDGGRFVIGAATTHHEVATSAVVRAKCPALADAAASIGDQQVRNRGTMGGSLAHADPSADYPAIMLALDAEIQIAGTKGQRSVKADQFFTDLFTVDLASDEVITGVRVTPVTSAAYAKLYQRASHYAIVGVAAALQVSGGTIQSARIGLTGASTHARRLTKVEQALAGTPANAATAQAAAAVASGDLADVNEDVHASADYRRAMVAVFTRRAIEQAIGRG
jgi:carbon-monoxide dehydrogenase medium subunit